MTGRDELLAALPEAYQEKFDRFGIGDGQELCLDAANYITELRQEVSELNEELENLRNDLREYYDY